MTYQPDWDVDRATGEEAEQFYRELRSAVLSGTAEVKRDDRARETGQVYVEYQCRRRDGWHPSGIASTKADTWVIYVEPALIALPVATLKTMCRAKWVAGARRECVVGSHPTKGVVLPVRELLPAAIAAFHGTAQGAPTDEPPAPAPADTDADATSEEWTAFLPTAQQAREYADAGTFTPDPDGWMS